MFRRFIFGIFGLFEDFISRNEIFWLLDRETFVHMCATAASMDSKYTDIQDRATSNMHTGRKKKKIAEFA